MDRVSSYVIEEEFVAALPLCVRRLRGPGRARRLPPNAAYRSAGAVLRRVLIYSEDGQARVQVVRSDGLSPSNENTNSRLSSASPPAGVNAGATTPVAAAAKQGVGAAATAPTTSGLPYALSNAGSNGESQADASNLRSGKTTHISSQDAAAAHTQSQLRRERAASLAADTERRYEEAQESALTGLLHALPLLRVVPPLSLQQQIYTRAEAPLPPPPSSQMSAPSCAATAFGVAAPSGLHSDGPLAMAGTQAVSSLPGSPTASNERVGGAATHQLSPLALRLVQARYGAVMRNRDPSDGGRDNSSGAGAKKETSRPPGGGIRDLRGLGLSSAVLLSKEEMDEREGQAKGPEPATHTSIFTDGAAASGEEVDATLPPTLVVTAPQTPPPPLPSAPLSELAELGVTPSMLSDSAVDAASAEGVCPTDATSASLHGIFIDGGLTVTIKLGSSCDEPNSLRYVAWGGCKPVVLRAVVWRLLSDYAAVQVARQRSELQRKRRQYEGYTRQYCSALTMLAVSETASTPTTTSAPLTQKSSAVTQAGGSSAFGGGAGTVGNRDSASLSRLPVGGMNPYIGMGGAGGGVGIGLSGGAGPAAAPASSSLLAPHERAIIHQMLLDLPRHRSPVFHARRSVAGMARCLFLWSQRHPAVGYVQGMDDVVAIFYQVFLTDALRQHAREQQQQQRRQKQQSSLLLARHGTRLPSLPSSAHTRHDLRGSSDRFGNESATVSDVYGLSSVAEKAPEDDGDGDGDERSTREIMRLLLLSVKPHRQGGGPSGTTIGSTPSTPNASSTAVAALVSNYERTSAQHPAASEVLHHTEGATTRAATTTTTTTVTAAATPLHPDDATAGASDRCVVSSFSPFLTEADVDVHFRTPAALDAALSELPESYLTQVEADTFFCAGRVLSFLQDNFMPGQPGILRNVRRLEALVRRVDPAVVRFLDDYGLTVMDGCFQWLHCLLARELPLSLLLRLWDCYLAIGVGGDRALSGGASSGLPSSMSVGGQLGGGGNVGMGFSPSLAGGGGMASAPPSSASSASDEAIMYFHVCVCCALLRTLRASLTCAPAASSTAGSAPPPPSAASAAASTSTVGGWAAALVTALPGFRSRAAPNNNTNSSNNGGDHFGGNGASSHPALSIDVVMTAMKKPFETLFPNYPSTEAKQQRLDAVQTRQRETANGSSSGSSGRTSSARPSPTPAEESAEEVAAERWLDLLIADAYCIWRLHPLGS